MKSLSMKKQGFLRATVTLVVCITCFCFGSREGWAQDISVEATVNKNRVKLGASLQLTITINGAEDASPLKLPELDGFESQYLGPSTRISVINGQYSKSTAYIYNLIPLKVGKFQIPAFSISINRENYTTHPINIEVVDSAVSASSSQSRDLSQSTSLQDKVFLIMKVPKEEVYINEKLPVVIRLFIAGVNVRNIQYPVFDHIGFNVDEFSQPKQYEEVLKGIRYQIIDFYTAIYPTRPGKLTLGPAHLECHILIEKSGRRRLGGGGIFDDEFFDNFFGDSFFGSYQKYPIAVQSSGLSINVLPLPEDGKPDNFSGAVGQFNFDVTAAPLEVKVGDPITLRMEISGTGNLKTVAGPTFKDQQGFKLYDPQIKEEDGIKISEQVVIPTSEKVLEIPAIHFSYFDPATREYKTISKGPFPLKVVKPEKSEEFQVVGLPAASSKIYLDETFGQDIVFIKDWPGRFSQAGKALYKNVLFWMVVFFMFFLWSGLWMMYKQTHKLKTDVLYARRFHAPKRAKKGLLQAKRLMGKEEQTVFYNVISKTLQEYLAGKFHLSSAGMTLDVIENIMRLKPINGEILGKIKAVFEECDMVRFASVNLDKERMATNYKKVEEIIDYLERYCR